MATRACHRPPLIQPSRQTRRQYLVQRGTVQDIAGDIPGLERAWQHLPYAKRAIAVILDQRDAFRFAPLDECGFVAVRHAAAQRVL